MDVLKDLIVIRNTLEKVHVAGTENLSYMLGTVRLVNKLIAELQKEANESGNQQNMD